MQTPSADLLRASLRATIDRLGGGAAFTDSDDLFDTGVVRSMNLIELIVSLEDDFGVVASQRDVFEGRLRSIDRLVAFVTARAVGARG